MEAWIQTGIVVLAIWAVGRTIAIEVERVRRLIVRLNEPQLRAQAEMELEEKYPAQ